MKRAVGVVIGLALFLGLGEALARHVHELPGLGPSFYRGGRGPESDRLGWYLLGAAFRGGGQVGYDPVLGWVPVPGQWDEHGATVTVNAQGFRGTAPTPPTPPPGRTRVLAVGDSFTFGSEATDGTTWPDRLGALRPDLDVVNLGVFGYGLDQMWLRYRAVGRTLGARVVLIAFIDDDYRRTLLDFHVYERPNVPAEEGVFEPTNTPLPTWEEERAAIARTPRLWMLGKMALVGQGRTDFRLAARRGDAILGQLVADVRADGAVPVLIHLPTGWDVDRRKSTDPAEYDTPERRSFLERCARHEVACVDLLPPMLGHLAAGVDLTAIIHYSEQANDLVARELLAALVAEGVLPATEPSPTDAPATP